MAMALVVCDNPNASEEERKQWTKLYNKRKYIGMPTQQEWGGFLKRQKTCLPLEFEEDDACM